MTNHVKNLVGKKFGQLLVKSFDSIRGESSHSYWVCICDCGNKTVTRGSRLKTGNTISCGCYNKKRASEWLRSYASSSRHQGKGNPAYKHGDSKTLFFTRFMAIRQRCIDPKATGYKSYGGRGIKFLWKSYADFKEDMYPSFLIHSKKHGTRNTTIERKNVNGNYCKKNCTWATVQEQALNRRTNVFITYKGIKLISTEWDKKLGFPAQTVSCRKELGWTDEESITTPLRKHSSRSI